jgi:hypothetical protein
MQVLRRPVSNKLSNTEVDEPHGRARLMMRFASLSQSDERVDEAHDVLVGLDSS